MKKLGLKHEEIAKKPSTRTERSPISRFAAHFAVGAALIGATLAATIGLPRNARAQDKPAVAVEASVYETIEVSAKDILAGIQAVRANKYELVIPKMSKHPLDDMKLAKIPTEGGKSTILLSPNGTISFHSKPITSWKPDLTSWDVGKDYDSALPGFTPDSSGHEKMTLVEVPFKKVNGEETSFVVYATSNGGFIVFARDYTTNQWKTARSYWPSTEAERQVLANSSSKPTLGVLKDSDGNFDILFVSPSTLQGVLISFYPPTKEEPELGISQPGLIVPKPPPSASLK